MHNPSPVGTTTQVSTQAERMKTDTGFGLEEQRGTQDLDTDSTFSLWSSRKQQSGMGSKSG
jgi:hypothetical protein